MTLNITLPEIDVPGKKSTESKTKDIIISILIRDYPLTSRKLHRALKAEYQYMVTYQAVHKAVKLLLEQKVLKMEGKGYSINEEWIENVTKFVDELHSVYHKKKPLFGVKEAEKKEGMQTLKFASLRDSMDYMTSLQHEYFTKPKPKPAYCAHLYHYNFPIAYPSETQRLMDATSESVTPWYVLMKNSMKLDSWTANMLQKNPLIKVRMGVDVAQTCDTRVFGDIVVQTYFPKEAIEYMDKIFKDKETPAEINVHEFQEGFYNKKRDIKVVVFHNPEIARQLRKQTFAQFNVKKVAFFDLDGPLLSRPPFLDFAEFLVKRQMFPEETMATIRKLYNDYKAGKIPYSNFSLNGTDHYMEGLVGKAVDDLNAAAKEFVEKLDCIHPYSKALLAFLKSKGYFIVGISASTEDILKSHMKHLFGLDLFYTTKIEVVDGRMTSQFETHLGREYAKESIMMNFLYNNNMDFNRSMAFGDTLNDVPLLRFVGMPIVLNPNNELRDYAATKGWQVLTLEDDVMARVKEIIEENKRLRS